MNGDKIFSNDKTTIFFFSVLPNDVLKFRQLINTEAVTYATMNNGRSFNDSSRRLALNGRTAQYRMRKSVLKKNFITNNNVKARPSLSGLSPLFFPDEPQKSLNQSNPD